MAIDFNARLNIQAIAGAEAAIGKFTKNLEAALSNVKINIKVGDSVGQVINGLSKSLDDVNKRGLGGLVKSLNELRKAGGDTTKIFKSFENLLDPVISKGEKALSTVDKTINKFFSAIASGNEKRAKALANDLNSLLVGNVDIDGPVQRRAIEGLTKGVQLQKRLLDKSREDELRADKDFAQRKAAQDKLNSDSAVDRRKRQVEAERRSFISGIENRGGGRVLPDIERQNRENAEFIRRRREQDSLNSQSRIERERRGLISGIESRGGGEVLGDIEKRRRLQRSLIDDAIRQGEETKRREEAFIKEGTENYRRGLAERSRINAEAQRRDAQILSRRGFTDRIEQRGIRQGVTEGRQVQRNIRDAESQLFRIERLVNETDALNDKLNKPQSNQLRQLRGRQDQLRQFITSGGSGDRGIFNADNDKRLIAAVKDTNKLNRGLLDTTVSIESFGRAAALAFKRYAAFVAGSAIIYQGIAALKSATTEALKFEKALTNVEQVLDVDAVKSVKIADAIREAAIATGTAANDIATGVLTFAQAGQKSISDLANVAKLLADVPLTATFGTIDETVQGLIAVQGQFNKKLSDTGAILDIVNQFAADFGVESRDIFEGVKRGGSAFASAGGQFEDFVALFSILREKSRESADSLGVFFKTGLSQLINPRSQALLKELGVTATDVFSQINQLSGLFFGPNAQFSGNQAIQISAKLVGDRQFNRLLTLLSGVQDPNVQARIQQALLGTPGSFERSIGKRLDDVGTSLNRVKNAFLDFALGLSQDRNIKQAVKDFADLAVTLATVFKNLSGIIPLLTIAGASAFAPLAKRIGGSAIRNLGLTNTVLSRDPRISGSFTNRAREIQDSSGLSRRESILLAGNIQSQAQQERRSGLRRLGGAGAAVGLFGVGSLLQSNAFNNRSGQFGASQAGEAIQSGVIGAAIAAGLEFGPLGIAIGATIGVFKSLKDSAERLRQEGFDELLKSARTPQEQIGAAISISGRELNPSTNRGLSNFVDQVFDAIGTGLNSLTSGTSNEQAFDAALRTRQRGFSRNPLLSRDIFNTPGLLQTENLRRQITSGSPTGNAFSNSIKLLTEDIKKEFSQKGLFPSGGEIRNALTQKVLQNPQVQQSGLGKDQINILLDAAAKAIKGLFDPIKRISPEIDLIKESVDALSGASIKVKDALIDVNKGFDSASAILDTISLSLNEVPKISAPTNNRTLLKAFGFDQLNNFDKQTELFGQILGDFVNNNRANLDRFANTFDDAGERSSGVVDSFKQFFKNQGVSEKFDVITPLLERFAAETKKTIPEVFKAITENSDSFRKFVEGIRVGGSLVDDVSASLRKTFDIMNKRIQVERDLRLSIEETNQKIFENSERIRDAGRTIEDRQGEATNFRRTDVFNIAREQSELLRGRSNTSIPGTPNFSQEFTGANQRVAVTTQRLNELQRQLQSGTASIKDLSNAVSDNIDAQVNFARFQNELNNKISDFDRRIGDAANATTILRDAFTKFKGGIEAAGQSVTGFTTKELAGAFTAFQKFRKGGLESLSDKDFSGLTKLLGTVGDLDLGSGISGNKLLGDINQQLGISITAAVRSLVSGRSQDEEARTVVQQLEDLKQSADDAAQAEIQLRQSQIELFGLQKVSLDTEAKFRTDQLTALKTIADKIDTTNLSTAIANLGTTVNQNFSNYLGSFKVPLPITFDKQDIVKFPGLDPKIEQGIRDSFDPRNLKKQLDESERKFENRESIRRFQPNSGNKPLVSAPGPFNAFAAAIGASAIAATGNSQQSITTNNDPFIKAFQNLGDKLGPLDQLKDISGKLDTISTGIESVRAILDKISQVGGIVSKLEVSPIMVNVSLTAPDIIGLVGEKLQSSILAAIGTKLASVFSTEAETLGKIKASFGG